MTSHTILPLLSLPVINGPQYGLDALTSVVYDPVRGLVYVGGMSKDSERRGLAVFPVERGSLTLGTPRVFSDHPDPLPTHPVDRWSLISCLLLDSRFPNKLYMGLNRAPIEEGSHTPLVVYDLNDEGWPVGEPRAYGMGGTYGVCWDLALHPKLNQLYAVGFGMVGFSVTGLDGRGEPVGPPVVHDRGGAGSKRSLGFRSNGTKLYMGRHPWTLEVASLGADGAPAGPTSPDVSTHAIPHAPEDAKYLAVVVRDEALFCKGPDGVLSYFSLDSAGEPLAGLRSTGIDVQSVSTAAGSDRILVGISQTFEDVLTGETKVDGTIVQELAFDREGVTGVVSRSSLLSRQVMSGDEASALTGMSSMLTGIPAPVIAVEARWGFLGNRVAGLNVRASLRSVTPAAPLTLASNSVRFSAEGEYLRFAYSAARNMVYASGEDETGFKSLYAHAVGGDTPGPVASVPCPLAAGPVGIDDALGVVYAARTDGTLAVRTLDAAGMPATSGEDLPTGLRTIEAIYVNPFNHLVYVFGPAGAGAAAADSPIVSIPVERASEAVVVPEFGRLYACTYASGHDNVCVWALGDDGRPSDLMPVRYSDGLPHGAPPDRGLLFTIRVDGDRRKLYVGGYLESASGPPWEGAVVVYDLDRFGDPTSHPRPYPTANALGAVWGIELSPNGRWLYEVGFGDYKVFTWGLDALGEPGGRPESGTSSQQGKQLQTTADGSRLLAGTHPSILEIVDLAPDGQTVRGAKPSFEIRTGLHEVYPRTVDLGLLVPGGTPSQWIDMDYSLRDGVGLAVCRLLLPASIEVERASVRFEVAQAAGGEMRPLKSFVLDITGNIAALILPRYGIDDLSRLTTLIQSSTERYAQHAARAAAVAIPPHERPAQFVVANGLIGIDSNPEAMRLGVEAVGALGHNTVEVWNFPGVSPAAIRTAVAAEGIRRFRIAVYNPPAYFDFYTDLMRPTDLASWAAGFRNTLDRMGAGADELALIHMADEPGWYFPYMTDRVRELADGLAVFRAYLQAKGLTPDLLGHATWDTVVPIGLSAARGAGATHGAKRLFFWSARFFAESLSNAFAAESAALRRELNPDLLITTNLNNWPGRFFVPSPNEQIGYNDNIGPDAAMGMPDWFDLGRKRAVSCLWAEDWFADHDAQLWSLLGDLLRCAAREGDLAYGGYVVGQSMSWSNLPDGATYKVMALAAHGAKALEIYIFGEILAFGDSWSENYYMYRPLTDALRLLRQGEQLLYPGRPRAGTVALLLPQASQVWDPDANDRYHLRELYGLHAALIHAQYPVDFIDDFAVEGDALNTYGYEALYVSAPNLSARAQERILSWVRAGGSLALLPGACAADEYDQPTEILWAAAGATRPAVPREPVPPPPTAQLREPQVIERVDDHFPVPRASTLYQVTRLTPIPGAGHALARFSDGSAAVVASMVDRGRIISFGYWPGTTYWYSPYRSNPSVLPGGWSAEARAIVNMPAGDTGARRHVSVSAPGVEAALLESDEGIALTLLNWFATPLGALTVTIHRPHRTDMAEVRSLKSGVLRYEVTAGGLQVTLPRLETVDVIMMFYRRATPGGGGCLSTIISLLRWLCSNSVTK